MTKDSVWSLGAPVVTGANEQSLHWEDSRWRRSHARRDCGIFTIAITSSPLAHKPVVCDPVFDSPTGRILQGGAIVSSIDGDRIFAVAAARPYLTIAQPDGQILKDVSYLESQEAAPSYTIEDEKEQYASPAQALAIRDRFPAFIGIARWEGAIGLLFRKNTGGAVKFSMDLFSYSGKKLANDVKLPFPDGHDRAHVLLVNSPGGHVFAIFRDRTLEDGRWPISRQELVELNVVRESEPRREGLLHFELRDGRSGEAVRMAKASLARDHRTIQLQIGDSEGIFEVPVPQGEGTVHLRVEANGYLPGGLDLPSEQAATGGDLGTLFLDPGVVVQGTLLNTDTGEPLVGAQISVTRHHPWGSLAARWLGSVTSTASDASGVFRLSGLEPGSVCLSIEHPLVAEVGMSIPSLGASSEPLDLGTVWLGTGVRLTGTTVDADGAPVGNVRVELRSGPWRSPCLRLTTTSDEDGIFRFQAVSPGNFSALALQNRQIGALRRVKVPTKAIDIGALRLQNRAIEGTILLTGDLKATGTLTLTRGDVNTFAPPPVFFANGSGNQEIISDLEPSVVVTVDQGEFSTRGFLPPGSVIATFIPTDGTGKGMTYRSRVEIPSESQPVRLSLDWSGEPLLGSVVDAAGEPVSGARVSLYASGLAIRETASTPDGEFEIDGVPAGDHPIQARHASLKGEVVARQGTSVRLVLHQDDPGSVTISVATSDTASRAGGVVALASDSGCYEIRQIDSSGRVIFEDVEPGSYKVAAAVHGALTTGPALTVEASGGKARATLDPQAGQPVEILLGEKMLGSEAILLSGDGTSFSPLLGFMGMQLTTDEVGRLTTPPLTAGRWQLYFPAVDRRIPFRVDPAHGAGGRAAPVIVDLR